MDLLGGLIEAVHGVHELVVQHVGVLVGAQLVGHQALLVALVVLGDAVLVLRVDLHAELVLDLTVVLLTVLQLQTDGSFGRSPQITVFTYKIIGVCIVEFREESESSE